MQKKIKALIVVILLFSMQLSGCSAKQIFQDSGAKYELVAYSDNELSDDVYYVKDGVHFYETYTPSGNKTVYYTGRDSTLIPSMYAEDGFIAYASKSTDLSKVELKRYNYVGYSFGIYGAKMDSDGYISFSVKKNVVSGTSAEDALFYAKSDSIRIVAVNDTPVSADMISDNGVFLDLTQDTTYKITYYAGTYYGETEITADIRMYELYETYNINSTINTKNGYLAIYMPEGMKSGYYSINDAGLFKYYDFAKGEQDEDTVDMNEYFYQSKEEQILSGSQQYVVSVTTKTYNAGFAIYYDTDVYSDEEISCYLTSPNKTVYTFDVADGIAYVEIAEAMSGRWTINILPSDLIVNDIKVESTAKADDTTKESKDFVFLEEDSHIRFYATYTGEGDVWGTVTNEDGESQALTLDKKTNTLSYTYPYLAPGTYTVTIYHYADTNLEEVNYDTDLTGSDEEILIIIE